MGFALGEREATVRPPDGGLRRLRGERRLERRTAARRRRGDGRARQHARDLHLRRQRREHGGDDHRLVQRADDAERDQADARAAAVADRRLRRAEAWGTDAFAPHYASAWAWAGNAPFQWGKQVASHLGGTRNGMVISWPERIREAGGLRSQFTHCIDVGPTILEAAGIPEPEDRGRDGTEADGGDELHVQLRRCECRRAAHHAVLQDLRQPSDIQGWLVGSLHARSDPVGRVAAIDREICSWNVRPRAGHVGALLPARRLRSGPRPGGREPGKACGAEGALLGGGRAAQRPAADGGVLGLLRDPAADACGHDHDEHASTATSRT